MKTLFPLCGLKCSDFTKIADEGLGDGYNAYVHSMAWFQDYLYLGTTRANLCMVHATSPFSVRCWPVRCPEDIYELDRRAQIWRYDPRLKKWQQVFASPLIRGKNRQEVARDIGYRGMAVYQGHRDLAPALYVCGWSPSRSERPPTIIRSDDGITFQPVSESGKDPAFSSYRTLLPLDGRLYTSPTGRIGSKHSVSGCAIVLENSRLGSEAWRPVSEPGFGDPANLTVFEMAVLDGSLYAGTLNPAEGFQIWKTKPVARPPYEWNEVITQGAYRGNLNESVISMSVFKGALYVGTGIQNGGYDRTYHVGPAAAEIIRIHPDDSWDLIVGESRWTPDGFKFPLSGFGPGFDDFTNGYVWRMAEHDGWLYAGTYNWSVFLPYLTLEPWPVWLRNLVHRIGIENIVRNCGGFDLWRTWDGNTWIPVTLTGFSNPYNYGVRTMVSTEHGLFLGTANPFGPDVAIETVQGWKYVPNPKGGLEVWQG